MFKFKITLDSHNAGQKLSYCVHLDTPLFLLLSTFKCILNVLYVLYVLDKYNYTNQ
jgi:hypothetical protein